MRISQRALTWGMAAVTAIGLALPASADRFWDVGGHAHIGIGIGVGTTVSTVRVVQERPQDETAVFQQWYANQVRGYTDLDEQTGEHLYDIVEMVTDVFDNYTTIVDQSNLRNNIFINERTRVVFTRENQAHPVASNGALNLTAVLRPGDLIIANGHLRSHGGLMAHSIRVVGHCSGYGVDMTQPAYGARFFGVIDRVDGAQGGFVVRMDDEQRSVLLDRDGAIWFAGKQVQVNYLRPGDRVIVYCRDRDLDHGAVAFRVVALQHTEGFPTGAAPCWADPDADTVVTNGPMLEGSVEYITTGTIFNTVYFRTREGRLEHARFPRTMDFSDEHGRHVGFHDLHAGAALRIHYSDVGGNHFAHRMIVK